MALSAPWFLWIGLSGLALAAALAWFLPFRKAPASLPKVSRSSRLTRQPQYRRALRLHQIVVRSLTVGSVLFAVAVSIGLAGPLEGAHTQTRPARKGDVVFCSTETFGGDLTRTVYPTTQNFFEFLRDKQAMLTNEGLGLSGDMLRPIPLTRDQQFLKDRLAMYVDFTRRGKEITKNPDSADYAKYQRELARFTGSPLSKKPEFGDYSFHNYTFPHVDGVDDLPPKTQTVFLNIDRLGFCLSGFSSRTSSSSPQTLIVYDDEFRLLDPLDQLSYDLERGAVRPEEIRPIFQEKGLLALAQQLKVTVNVVAKTDSDPNGSHPSRHNPLDPARPSAVAALSQQTGGIACRFYDPGPDLDRLGYETSSDTYKQYVDRATKDERRCLQKAWNRAERPEDASLWSPRRPPDRPEVPLAFALMLAAGLAILYTRVGA